MKKNGFTLAEVLITLAVIGIVAALTIDVFLPKIHSTIRARQIATAEVKFTKAMEQMALNNAIGPYYDTTQEFVDELQNYLKISKVCDNEHLADCFGYDKLLLSNGEEFELSEIKSGENLGKNEDYLETVGLVTIDGTGMIVSWNKKCDILEPKVYAWGNNTNETTSCVAILMDINLDKSPNRINKDIALFRAENPSKTIYNMEFTVGETKYCWGTPFEANVALTSADCKANKQTYGITNCGSADNDYWGYAMKTCATQGKRLPTPNELKALAQYLYGTQNINDSGSTTGLTLNTNKLTNLSNVLPIGGFGFWTGLEFSASGAYVRYFGSNSTNYFNDNARLSSSRWAVCVP